LRTIGGDDKTSGLGICSRRNIYAGKELADASRERDNPNSRVLRGGAWFSKLRDVHSSSRGADAPDSTALFPGFRLVMTAA